MMTRKILELKRNPYNQNIRTVKIKNSATITFFLPILPKTAKAL
jgi:hypothetical protein